MFGEQVKRRIRLLALTTLALALVTSACGTMASPTLEPTATAEPTHAPAAAKTPPPTKTPEPTDTPTPTNTPKPTNTPGPTNTPIPTLPPRPAGEVDTGMGGNLSIQGSVSDSSGNSAPYVRVDLWVCGEEAAGSIGLLRRSYVYTDETGFYSFYGLLRVPGGHYEVKFLGGRQYGETYEESEYWIENSEITGDVHVLDVTVHPVTGSTLSAEIQYEDEDGIVKDFLPTMAPDHLVELFRGMHENYEYPMGSVYSSIMGNSVRWDRLAGGTYFFQFTYRRRDGVLLQCWSPSFGILPGEAKQVEYTIRNCPPLPKDLFD